MGFLISVFGILLYFIIKASDASLDKRINTSSEEKIKIKNSMTIPSKEYQKFIVAMRTEDKKNIIINEIKDDLIDLYGEDYISIIESLKCYEDLSNYKNPNLVIEDLFLAKKGYVPIVETGEGYTLCYPREQAEFEIKIFKKRERYLNYFYSDFGYIFIPPKRNIYNSHSNKYHTRYFVDEVYGGEIDVDWGNNTWISFPGVPKLTLYDIRLDLLKD